ncbi:MAG TPA: hydrogenase 4 subunit F [Candidatus Hypogeohydataceae bacterium YC41]
MLKLILALPLITALLCLFCLFMKKGRVAEFLNLLGVSSCFIISILLLSDITKGGPKYDFEGLIYVDTLGGFFLCLVLLISLVVSIYSISYMRQAVEKAEIDRHLSRYYLLLNLFMFTMTMVATTGNLGVLWISIEATTLVSAFLVGYYNEKTALEAAWKYLILCTVGITFALFGTVLLYYASLHIPFELRNTLNWFEITRFADRLDPSLTKVAFIFILVGYGTKAGFAPMHTWLPDAHSQAPTPVSALLSGVLLKCSIYGILRFYIIASKCLGMAYLNNLLLIFGIFSLVIATFFILIQKDIKRLLAYSSLENVGIIATGIGFGGLLGVYGALFHILNHALVKSLMFFVGGNLSLKYHTKNIEDIKGAVGIMPITGAGLLLGSFALTGLPPFNMFMSEIAILAAGFSSGNILASCIFLVALVVIFAGILRHTMVMAFNPPPQGLERGEVGNWAILACFLLLVPIVLLGICIPGFLDNVLNQSVSIIIGEKVSWAKEGFTSMK